MGRQGGEDMASPEPDYRERIQAKDLKIGDKVCINIFDLDYQWSVVHHGAPGTGYSNFENGVVLMMDWVSQDKYRIHTALSNDYNLAQSEMYNTTLPNIYEGMPDKEHILQVRIPFSHKDTVYESGLTCYLFTPSLTELGLSDSNTPVVGSVFKDCENITVADLVCHDYNSTAGKTYWTRSYWNGSSASQTSGYYNYISNEGVRLSSSQTGTYTLRLCLVLKNTTWLEEYTGSASGIDYQISAYQAGPPGPAMFGYIGAGDDVAHKVKAAYVGVRSNVPVMGEIMGEKEVEFVTSNLSKYFGYKNPSGNAYLWNFKNDPNSGVIFYPYNIGKGSSTCEATLICKENLTNVKISGVYYTESGYDKLTLKVKGTTVLNGVSGTSSTDKVYWSGNLSANDEIYMLYTKDGSGDATNESLTRFTINTDPITEPAPELGVVGYEIKSVARKIKKGYVGVNGVARLCYLGEGNTEQTYSWEKYAVIDNSIHKWEEYTVNTKTVSAIVGNPTSFTINTKTSSTTGKQIFEKAPTYNGSTWAFSSSTDDIGVFYYPSNVESLRFSIRADGSNSPYMSASDFNSKLNSTYSAYRFTSNPNNGDIYRISSINATSSGIVVNLSMRYTEEDRQEKGTYRSDMTHPDRSYYPDNGVKGSYWYVYKSSDEHYAKGDLVDSNVISTNPNHYPTNGVHTDGYWYVSKSGGGNPTLSFDLQATPFTLTVNDKVIVQSNTIVDTSPIELAAGSSVNVVYTSENQINLTTSDGEEVPTSGTPINEGMTRAAPVSSTSYFVMPNKDVVLKVTW